MIKINDIQINVHNMRTRMPFKFGISTMTVVPHLVLTVDLEDNNITGRGYSADHLPPKWFTKDSETSFEDDVSDMIKVVRYACKTAKTIGNAPDVFAFWRELYSAQKWWGTSEAIPPLLWGLGVSLVERAVIEAVCRIRGINFGDALRSNLLGLELGFFDNKMKDIVPHVFLPKKPLLETKIRHTIGLGDPLKKEDIDQEELCNDGLPQSLDEIIDTYGIYYFKIKLFGDEHQDFNRLKTIAQILTQKLKFFRFTLDGNENFPNMACFRSFWQRLWADKFLRTFLSSLICIEQPIHRATALSDDIAFHLQDWHGAPQFIIDESDGQVGDFTTAINLGYSGTSFKNCKGIFKGVFNLGYIKYLSETNSSSKYLMTSEDLSNIGPIALMQDLAVIGTLGINHTERNGHHYFKGLSGWSDEVQKQVLGSQPDLFFEHKKGFPCLQIQEGSISLKSVNEAPLGTKSQIDTSKLEPIDFWNYGSLKDVPVY